VVRALIGDIGGEKLQNRRASRLIESTYVADMFVFAMAHFSNIFIFSSENLFFDFYAQH